MLESRNCQHKNRNSFFSSTSINDINENSIALDAASNIGSVTLFAIFFLPVNTERFGYTFVVSSVSVFLNSFSNIGANFVRKLIFLFRLVVL